MGRGGAPAARPGQPPQGQNPPNGRGQLAARRPNLARGPIAIDIPSLAPDTSDESRTMVVASLLAGQASAATKQTLARAETPQHLIALALGSPEFQRR
jgi:hypothetical protein